jgi:capsular exopolysaccharide synthesis family protein
MMCISAVITATLLTYVLSEKYKSATIVLIRPRETIDLVPKRKEILDFPLSYHSPVETASKTYTEILKSRVVAERVIQLLGLGAMKEDKGTGWRYYWRIIKSGIKGFILKTWTLLKYGRIEESDLFNQAVSEIQGGLSVKPTKETYLFEIEAEARSPQLAAAIANASAKSFMDFLKDQSLLELKGARQLSEEKVEQARQRLENARQDLVDYKERHKIVSLSEETTLQLKLFGEIESSLKTVNTDINGAIAQKKKIARQLAEIDNFTKYSSKVIDNPILRDLKLQLVHKEIALKGKRERFTTDHRGIRLLQAEINEIKAKIKQHDPTLDSEVTSTVNPIHENLLENQTDLENQLASLQAQKVNLLNAIEKKKTILEKLPVQEARLANLELLITLQQQTYELLSRESEELKMAVIRKVPDIQMIHAAMPPLYPVRPIKIYHAGLAAILSLIVGIGIALLKEHMNQIIRSAHEAEQELSLPALMTVPHLALSPETKWPLITEKRKELPEVIRKHNRVGVQRPIEVKSNNTHVATQGELIDISMGGACFNLETGCHLDPRDEVVIEFDDAQATGKKAIAEGVVVRSEQATHTDQRLKSAIEFVHLNEAMAKEIKRLTLGQNNNHCSFLSPDFEEPIRGLRADIQYFNKAAMSSFLITSSVAQEGKSTITANLGLALVAIKKSVVLVDANLRCPSLHQMFGLSIRPGLLNILSENKSLTLRKLPSGLCVLTSGSLIKDPSVLLGSSKMLQLINLLKKNFDFVLIDTPPLLSGPDTTLLSSIADGVIMVIDTGITTFSESRRAKAILEKSSANILGMVMNKYNSDYESYYKCSTNSI